MDIKLVFSDIDHTILPSKSTVSAATVSAVRALAARGIEFVVASGRWYPAARLIAVDQLGIENGYMICANGGQVVRTNGEVLKEFCVPEEKARQVYEILRGAGVMINSYVRSAIYRLNTERLTRYHLPEASGFFAGHEYAVIDNDVSAFEENALRGSYKLEAYTDAPERLTEVRAALISAGLSVSSSFPFNLEITCPGYGKGVAVRWLMDQLGAARAQTMGFGDYTNDLAMLREVGWPVAVANAPENVRRECRHTAPSCEDDGVARTIFDYVLGDETL